MTDCTPTLDELRAHYAKGLPDWRGASHMARAADVARTERTDHA